MQDRLPVGLFLVPLIALSFICSVSGRDVPDVQDQIQTYYTPFDREQAEAAILDMVHNAKSEIRGNAYGLTDPDFVQALIEAHGRGVDEAWTIDSTQAAGPHEKPFIVAMQKDGIDVQIGKSPVHDQLLHMKGFEVDKTCLEDGSLNYSPSGLQQYNFINIYKSPKRVKMFLTGWQKIYNHLAPNGPHAGGVVN